MKSGVGNKHKGAHRKPDERLTKRPAQRKVECSARVAPACYFRQDSRQAKQVRNRARQRCRARLHVCASVTTAWRCVLALLRPDSSCYRSEGRGRFHCISSEVLLWILLRVAWASEFRCSSAVAKNSTTAIVCSPRRHGSHQFYAGRVGRILSAETIGCDGD